MKNIFVLLLLCFAVTTSAQKDIPLPDGSNASEKKELKKSKNIGARWVFNPKILPVVTIAHKQFDIEENQLEVINLSNATLGLRAEKYKPNDNIGYGADLEVSFRNFVYHTDRDFQVEEAIVNFTPFFTFKRGGLSKTKSYLISGGFMNSFVVKNEIRYLDDQSFLRSGNNQDITKKYRLYGYLEFGLKRDVFYSNWNKVKRSGHSTISLGVLLPFFNQSATFKNKNGDFTGSFEVFRKNRSSFSGLVLNYTQNIDVKQNQSIRPYEDRYVDFFGITERDKGTKDSFLTKGNYIYLPPLINFYNPEKPFFGNFYVRLTNKASLDSLSLNGVALEDPVTNLRSSFFYSFGYSFHFLGNYSNKISARDRSSDQNKLHWDFFVSAGLSNRTFNLSNWQTLGRYRSLLLELNGGLRLGVRGIYITGGYEYALPFSNRLVINDMEYDGFKLDNIANTSIFFGLGFRNSIYIKAALREITSIKTVEDSMDNLEFSIGFGI